MGWYKKQLNYINNLEESLYDVWDFLATVDPRMAEKIKAKKAKLEREKEEIKRLLGEKIIKL